jgi:chorismate mutase/prephenate dehydratase
METLRIFAVMPHAGSRLLRGCVEVPVHANRMTYYAPSVMTLPDLRKRIDDVDDQLLGLLAQRAEIAHTIAEAKRAANAHAFHDPDRERQVLERVAGKGAGLFPQDAIRVVFREVMSACLSLEEPLHIAYMGPEGTFSQAAAHRLFGLAARYHEATTIDGVIDAVRAGACAAGVVPIENSTEGSVTVTADALLDGDLVICQEIVLEVEQCLLSRATSLAHIERVYSHPQALAQCRAWLAKSLPNAQIVQTSSTSGAAIEAHGDDRAAAIGSRLAGEIHGLSVVRERIQDRPENATRFVVIGKQDAKRTGRDKTSIAFSVKDGRGALRQVLTILEDAGVNLTRIESRPSRQKAWDYVFVADLEGHRDDPNVAQALRGVRAHCPMMKLLGSYPRA